MVDPVTTVDRLGKAIERVLESDGWIDDIKVYQSDDLRKIAESMARRASDPESYVNQGFHNTSVTQSKMRQALETDPLSTLEPIADLVTTGRARVGVEQIEVTVDGESLKLDLESRLATPELIKSRGLRDAAGQLYDLMVTQALWSLETTESWSYRYTQEPYPEAGVTGEKLVKVDRRVGGRRELLYEGPAMSIEQALTVSRIIDGKPDGFIVHSSLLADQKHFEGLVAISSERSLRKALERYYGSTRRPCQVVVFSNSLLNASYASCGHDLKVITVRFHEESSQYFCQSHWGQSVDSRLNGISGKQLLAAMKLPQRTNNKPQDYDTVPPHERKFDPAFPVKPADRAEQNLVLAQESARLKELERNAMESPQGKELARYHELLAAWESARDAHERLFGDAIPFNKPMPRRPGS